MGGNAHSCGMRFGYIVAPSTEVEESQAKIPLQQVFEGV